MVIQYGKRAHKMKTAASGLSCTSILDLSACKGPSLEQTVNCMLC